MNNYDEAEEMEIDLLLDTCIAIRQIKASDALDAMYAGNSFLAGAFGGKKGSEILEELVEVLKDYSSGSD